MKTEVRFYEGAEAIQSLREIWETLQHHPNSDYEHFVLVCRLRAEVLAPIALGLWENGKCVALIAGRLEKILLRPNIGYARLPGIQKKVLTIIQEGILGEMDARRAMAVVEALYAFLARSDADVVCIHHLRGGNAIWDALRRRRGLTLGLERPRWTMHREMTLGGEPGFLFGRVSSKGRNTQRRKERKFSEAFPKNVRWLWYSQVIDLNQIFGAMETVAQTTYQRGLGAGFIDNEETRQRYNLFARRGEMRVFLLEIDGAPKSFWLGTVYRGIFHSNALGYSPDMEDYGVGNLIFFRMVDELVREGVDRVDFGLGEAHYKERFADKFWREASLHLFNMTAKGRLLRGYLGTAAWLDNMTRRAVQRLGILDRIKRTWRHRLRGKEKGQGLNIAP